MNVVVVLLVSFVTWATTAFAHQPLPYAKDPDGLEFEVFWTVPGGTPVGTRALNLDAELAKRGLPVSELTLSG
jgi:hypothetical protein